MKLKNRLKLWLFKIGLGSTDLAFQAYVDEGWVPVGVYHGTIEELIEQLRREITILQKLKARK